MKCERCAKAWGRPITLVGGREADLCGDCLAIWHEHLRVTESWAHSIEFDAKRNNLIARALAGDAPTKEEWLEYHRQADANATALFALGDKWLRESRQGPGASDGT